MIVFYYNQIEYLLLYIKKYLSSIHSQCINSLSSYTFVNISFPTLIAIKSVFTITQINTQYSKNRGFRKAYRVGTI